MPTISQAEEDILSDIDRLISFYRENNKPLKRITVSKQQFNALKRLRNKSKKGPLIRRVGSIIVGDTTYNGIEFEMIDQRAKRKRSDTDDMF